MKKIILTVAAVFALSFANAQDKKEGSEGFAKGDLYLTGLVGFSSESTGNQESSSFTVAPGLGYFLTENVAIQANIGISSEKNNGAKLDINEDGVIEPGTYDVNNSGMKINVGVKYFWNAASKFSVSIGGDVSYGSIKGERTPNVLVPATTKTTIKALGFNVPLGLNYFVSNNFALSASWGGLGYSSNDNGGNGAEKTTGFNLSLDTTNLSFGMIYKL